jgi:hypothetical protein
MIYPRVRVKKGVSGFMAAAVLGGLKQDWSVCGDCAQASAIALAETSGSLA